MIIPTTTVGEGKSAWWQETNTKVNTGKKAHCRQPHLGMAISANASRLFCPPDSNAIGLSARSPLIPKEPNWWRYSSSLRPSEETG